MAFAPNTSPFITTALDSVDLPNSQVLAAGAGLQVISSGPGGNVTINPTQNLLSLTQIATDGILAINHSTNTIFTRTLSSDGTLTITNANGVGGSPLFSVTPESQVQLIQVSANGGSIVGAAPTLNFSGAGNTSISAVNEGSFINIVVSSTGGGGGGITSIVGTANQILPTTPITSTGTLSLSPTLIAPGTFTATTSVSTPILSITGAFNNPWATQPVSNGQVLSCSTGGVLAWINNGSGGSGVSSVGISSPMNTITVGSSTTNPITSTGTLQVDLPIPGGLSPGSFGTPQSMTVNAHGIVTAIAALPYALPTTTGTSGQVITYPSSGGQTTWQTPGGGGGGISAVNGTPGQVTAMTASGIVTLGLDNPLLAPGQIVATTNVTTPALYMSDFTTYTYALPITNGTSGQFLQTIGGGQCIWATASGGSGVPTVQGTAGQILINGVTTPISAAATFTIPNAFIAPGSITAATGITATTVVTTPALTMTDAVTYNYSLPVTNGTSGQFLQSIGGGQTIWASGGGGGGISAINGTGNQIAASTVSGTTTLSLPSTLIAPGTFQATTSVTTPLFTMAGSGYSYSLPTSNGTMGQVLSSNGGGATAWVPAGGGGSVSSVAAAVSNSTGLAVTPTTGAVTVGWDATQNAVLPKTLELNSTGASGAIYSFPATGGVPGSTLRWPATPTSGVYQLYWEDPYLVIDVTSTNFIITKTPATNPAFFTATVSLPPSGTITLPGSLTLTSTSGTALTLTGSAFNVTNGIALNPWPTLPSGSGGVVTCSTSGNITYNTSFVPATTQTPQALNFTFTGGSTVFAPNISYSVTGTTVTVTIDVSAYSGSGLLCDSNGSSLVSSTFTTAILPFPTNSNQDNTFLGRTPIYKSATGAAFSYYSYWYFVQVGAGAYKIICTLGIESSSSLATFTSGDTYFFGIDGNLSQTAGALTFTYSNHP